MLFINTMPNITAVQLNSHGKESSEADSTKYNDNYFSNITRRILSRILVESLIRILRNRSKQDDACKYPLAKNFMSYHVARPQ
jgi:hypothetical protein